MKSNRRDVIKGMVASVAGIAGLSLAKEASAEVSAPASHETIGEVVKFQNAPLFSPATKYGNLVFISGAGAHVAPYTIKNHAKIVMAELKKQIEAAGSSMDKVLECYCYIDDIAYYETMNKIFDKAFPKGKRPARTCITTAKGGIPGASLCEVDAICYI